MTAQIGKPARRRPGFAPGFTLVEMLVVIGIIVVLMAILVPVVSRMRIAAQTANTNAQLQRISAAINNYFNDYNAYPGVTPNHLFNPTLANSRVLPGLTQSEDLVLALMGGLVAKGSAASGYVVEYNPSAVGQGPVNINIKNVSKKNPYFSRRDEELTPGGDGKLGNDPEFSYVLDSDVPEFMDMFPEQRPILYMRCNPGISKTNINTPTQQILGPEKKYNSSFFAYNWETIDMYLKTPSKGFTEKTGDFNGKIATSPTNANENEVFQYFAGPSRDMPRNAGSYMLISAGPNRKFGDGDDIIYGSGGGQ